MDSRSEMFCPFVPHHKFCPVRWKFEGVNWPVFMESWQLLHTLFVPGQKQIDSKELRWSYEKQIPKPRFNDITDNHIVSDLLTRSPGVIDDLIQSPEEAFCGDRKNIQHDSRSSARQLLRVVGLVCRKWHHHHGDSMTQSLKETMWASMSDESPSSRMS